jgi:hypothetical protein
MFDVYIGTIVDAKRTVRRVPTHNVGKENLAVLDDDNAEIATLNIQALQPGINAAMCD